MSNITVLSTNDDSPTVTHYILRQETHILSQKVISATHYHESGTIIIYNGKHSIKTKANHDPIAAIKEAL